MLSRVTKTSYTARLCRTYASMYPHEFAQPHPTSHPHMFSSSEEITPGITKEEYHQRRKRLIDSIPDSSLVILRAASVKYMSKNIFYRFRQASDFWYLTGFEEPDATVVLQKDKSSRGYRMTFFCAEKTPKKELWEGPVAGLNGAKNFFDADKAYTIDKLPSKLAPMVSASNYIYTDLTSLSRYKRLPPTNVRSWFNPGTNLYPQSNTQGNDVDSILHANGVEKCRDLGKHVAKFRLVKSPAEQRLMKGAALRSARAHAMTMQFARPGLSEADLEAHFQYICAVSFDAKDGLGTNGCQRPAYVPVVASGRNALTIHHTTNNQAIQNGELVLIDAGGEWNGYASDITRTFPVSGTFTPAQRALYQAVLNVQKQCVSLLCTGSTAPSASDALSGGQEARVSLSALHRLSIRLLTEELVKIGFSFSSFGREVEDILYPHLVGHGVGIDLHESTGMSSEELLAGQVVTVEPGVYVPADNRFPREFHNIGIRIEDEVLIQKDHGVVLSVDAPKEIVDVEATCQGLVHIK